MRKSQIRKFTVGETVSPELKEAIMVHVKDQTAKSKKYKLTTRAVVGAMESTADKEVAINAIKTLVNQGMLMISPSRRSNSYTQTNKPFEERMLRLPGPGRGRPPMAKKEMVTEKEAK